YCKYIKIKIMNQPPPNQQQFQQQIPAGHMNLINGTNNIFNQQQPPAGHIDMMQNFITGTTDIFI
ncbi:1198_t:CDS:1, partial [Ambispora leptoticha]